MTGTEAVLRTAVSPIAPRQPTLPALTGVRAVAGVWVVCAHFQSQIMDLVPGAKLLTPLIGNGHLGVDLFFVLSGFIISYTHLADFAEIKSRPYLAFLGLRLARMYPVHLFTLLILTLGVQVASLCHLQLNMPERLGGLDFIRNLLLVHAWGSRDVSWNGPSWSISAEWFAYLLFPFCAAGLVRIRSTPTAVAGAAGSILVMLVIFGTIGFEGVAKQYALIRISCEFLCGCFIYLLYRDQWLATISWRAVSLAAVLTLVLYSYLSAGVAAHNALWAVPIFPVLILGLARSKQGLSPLLSTSTVVFWGQASYSLYMTHDLVRLAFNKLLPTERFAASGLPIRLLVLSIYALTLAGVAAGTFLIIEQPSRRFLRRLWGSPRPPVTPGWVNGHHRKPAREEPPIAVGSVSDERI